MHFVVDVEEPRRVSSLFAVALWLAVALLATGPQVSEAAACADAVQGKIAWNYSGSKSWAPGNVRDLCKGAEDSIEPAKCFRRVMHGGVDRGGSSRWNWRQASRLCAGTRDADGTIACYERKTARGVPWERAVGQCTWDTPQTTAESERTIAPGAITARPELITGDKGSVAREALAEAVERSRRGDAGDEGSEAVPVTDLVATREVVLVRPSDEKPPPVEGIRAVGAVELGGLELRTLNASIYHREGTRKYFYLPKSFRLIRDRDIGYRMTITPLDEERMRVAFELRAERDPSEIALMRRVVESRYESGAELGPLPYDDIEVRLALGETAWEVEEPIELPEFGSLDSNLPINFVVPTDAWSDMKVAIEREGLPGQVITYTSGDPHDIGLSISLRRFAGAPYSPLSAVAIRRRGGELSIAGVRNLSPLPLVIDAVDLVVAEGDGAEPRPVRGLPVDRLSLESGRTLRRGGSGSGLRLDPGERATLYVDVDGRGLPARLADDVLLYRLDHSKDLACQPCLDEIWDQLENVGYLERREELTVEVLPFVFEETSDAPALSQVNVAMRSPFFVPDVRGESVPQQSVSLRADAPRETLAFYAPAKADQRRFVDFRVQAVTRTDVSRWTEWRRVEGIHITLPPGCVRSALSDSERCGVGEKAETAAPEKAGAADAAAGSPEARARRAARDGRYCRAARILAPHTDDPRARSLHGDYRSACDAASAGSAGGASESLPSNKSDAVSLAYQAERDGDPCRAAEVLAPFLDDPKVRALHEHFQRSCK